LKGPSPRNRSYRPGAGSGCGKFLAAPFQAVGADPVAETDVGPTENGVELADRNVVLGREPGWCEVGFGEMGPCVFQDPQDKRVVDRVGRQSVVGYPGAIKARRSSMLG